MKLDKNKIYDLSDLTSEEKIELGNNIFYPQNIENVFKFPYIRYDKELKTWLSTECVKPTHNAKELFYTLENVQVDCRGLTEEQTKKMCDIYENKGYYLAIHAKENDEEACILSYNNITQDGEFGFYKYNEEENNQYNITYEKFMELFGYKEKSEEFNNLVEVLNEELTEEAYKGTEYEVKYIAEKPKHPLSPVIEKAMEMSEAINKAYKEKKPQQYQIGIDTFTRCESNMTKEEILACCKFNIDKYNWRNKGQDLEDLEKIISYANWAIKQLK